MRNNIGYHTRLASDNSVKVTGGSFGGSLDLETANRLSRFFTVVVKPSGTPVFVDAAGREVRLYISVGPDMTIKGAEALKMWREARAKQQEADELVAQARQEELDELTAGLSHDEIVRRLKGE